MVCKPILVFSFVPKQRKHPWTSTGTKPNNWLYHWYCMTLLYRFQDVSLQDISVSDISLPDNSIQDISLPDISLPGISLPEISQQDISLPVISKPRHFLTQTFPYFKHFTTKTFPYQDFSLPTQRHFPKLRWPLCDQP